MACTCYEYVCESPECAAELAQAGPSYRSVASDKEAPTVVRCRVVRDGKFCGHTMKPTGKKYSSGRGKESFYPEYNEPQEDNSRHGNAGPYPIRAKKQ